jgi:hypothetical protein
VEPSSDARQRNFAYPFVLFLPHWVCGHGLVQYVVESFLVFARAKMVPEPEPWVRRSSSNPVGANMGFELLS